MIDRPIELDDLRDVLGPDAEFTVAVRLHDLDDLEPLLELLAEFAKDRARHRAQVEAVKCHDREAPS